MSKSFLRSLVLPIAGLAFTLSLGAAQAATDRKDPGRKLYMTKTCVACHGRDGRKAMLEYPNLAGQEERYLALQMDYIISGKRLGSHDATGNPRAQGMRGALVIPPENTSKISKADMKLIAKWLAGKQPADLKPPKTPLDPDSVAAGETLFKKKCKSCHGKEGMKPAKGTPYLAGQKRAYLFQQLVDIRAKDRKTPKTAGMYGMVKRMTDEQFATLADYLSQIDRNADK